MASLSFSAAARANLWSNWISDIIGILISFFISLSAAASSKSFTAILIISQPAFSNFFIWETVDFISFVFVLVIDWIEIKESPPTGTLPT